MPKARAVMEALRAIADKVEAQVLSGLTAQEQEMLTALPMESGDPFDD
jgi:DNA-binding MarR family transcriptional regulator